MDFKKFFPYNSYRTKQKDVISKLHAWLEERDNILFSAPNGSGKTIDNLAAAIPVALENELKIVYLCRTHTQNARVIKEIQKINEKLKENIKPTEEAISEKTGKNTNIHLISAVSMRGRSEMCTNKTVKKIKGTSVDIMNICADLRKNRNCKHFNKMLKDKNLMNIDLKKMARESTDAQDLINFCRDRGYCPYFFTKLLLKSVNIIVCNYQWIFNPNILKTFKVGAEFELESSILIMDECHNLPDMAAEIDSKRLTEYVIEQCLKDLEKWRAKKEMINRVKAWIKIIQKLKESVKTKEAPLVPNIVLKKYLKLSEIPTLHALKTFIKDLEEYGNAIFEEKISLGLNPINFLSTLTKFMEKFIEVLNDNRYFLTAVPSRNRSGDNTIQIEILCMDPRDLVNKIYCESFATINCSGTISFESFSTLLGLNETGKDLRTIEINSPFPKKNVKVLIAESVNTRGQNRTDSMYGRMCKKITDVIFNTPGNIGIFCASYVVLRGLLNNGLEDLVKFSGKNFYEESSQNSASENADLIENFKSDAANSGAVLLGVCGGRNSEGEDFPGDFMNSVVIVGIPFFKPTPSVEAKIKYLDSVFDRKGRIFGYIVPAIRRANQAAGRPIRRIEDKGAIILLDFRFKNYFDFLSPWIRENAEIALDKPNIISKHLNTFFKT
ncbi:MAG: helicase C-terminal domain-containing protein [Promethearchaeota archaeon]